MACRSIEECRSEDDLRLPSRAGLGLGARELGPEGVEAESREGAGAFAPGKAALSGAYSVWPARRMGRSSGRNLRANQRSICLVEKGPCCLPEVSR